LSSTIAKLCDGDNDVDVAAISPSASDVASKVSNLQRVMTYCQQYLPSSVCHLSLTDLLYCASELRQNIVVFVVDLFDSLETIVASASAGSGGSGG